MVGQGAAVGVPVGVLSSLQDELLTLEVVVLKAHPAVRGRGEEEEGGVLAQDRFCSFCSRRFKTYAPLSTRMERMLSSPHS